MSVWDELRVILAEHCHPQQKDRALQLLDHLLQEERRRAASGELAVGGGEPQGFAVRPNGDITGPGHSSAFGEDALGANGVLWGPAMGGSGLGAAWGKGVGVGVADIPIGGGMGPWGGEGLGAGGAGWGFSGTRVASGGNGGLGVGIDDDAAVSAALSGLALDGAPGQPLGAWVPNPVASFDLDPAPVQDSRLGSFFMPQGASGPAAAPGKGQPQAAAPSAAAAAAAAPAPAAAAVGAAPPQLQQAVAAEPKTPPPQGNTAAKFSSVVGGTASGRPQVTACREGNTPPAARGTRVRAGI